MTSGDAMDMGDLRSAGAVAQTFLEGVAYPADKQEIIDCAKSAGAPDGVLEVFDRFREKQYSSSIDVEKEIDRVTRLRAYESDEGLAPR